MLCKVIDMFGKKRKLNITKTMKTEEIETLLNRSPYIKESLVYGKGQSDGDTVICAKIVPDLDKIKEDKDNNLIPDESIEKLIEKEVRDVNKAMINYKHIKEIALQEEEFIKTTTKKIKRHEVLKQ